MMNTKRIINLIIANGILRRIWKTVHKNVTSTVRNWDIENIKGHVASVRCTALSGSFAKNTDRTL